MKDEEQQPQRLAPHLIQSMEVLQMNWAELEIHIDRELTNNPCLEYVKLDQAPSQNAPEDSPTKNAKSDAQITLGPHGDYRVEITPLVRELRIKNQARQPANGDATTDEKQFSKRMISRSQWLIESIHQRKQTLTKVIQEIIRKQADYLASGAANDLVILKMESIAESVECNVTTVSRAIIGKSVETPIGKMVLSSFVDQFKITESNQGNEVRNAIVKLVDEENKSSPFSDYQLVNELKTLGFNVARRTVTKQRRILNIPSARQRRDWGDKT